MATDEKCPCDSVKQLRREFSELKGEVSVLAGKNQALEIKFATIDTKLNLLIGGIAILSVAVAAVVVPMIFS